MSIYKANDFHKKLRTIIANLPSSPISYTIDVGYDRIPEIEINMYALDGNGDIKTNDGELDITTTTFAIVQIDEYKQWLKYKKLSAEPSGIE